MDFVHVPEKGGFGQVLVVTDRFTKFTVLIPMKKSATMEDVYQALWERIFAIFGLPETITTDQDKLFRTEKWRRTMKNIGILQILSTANHQRTDGQTERKMQEIQSYLRMNLEDQKDWKEWLPILQFAINDAVSATTGETPHKATFGVLRKSVWKEEETGEQLSDKITKLHKQISMEIKWNHELMKRHFDKSRVEAPSLERGDRVYLRRRTKGNTRDNIFTKKESTKLDFILLGPFEIKKKLPFDNYELWLPPKMQIHPVFHISLLKPTENPATKENVEANEFEVEKVIAVRTKNGKKQYKIRWTGYESKDDTWEPEKNLNCPEKVQEFEDSREQSEESESPPAESREIPMLAQLAILGGHESANERTIHQRKKTHVQELRKPVEVATHLIERHSAEQKRRIDKQPKQTPSFVDRMPDEQRRIREANVRRRQSPRQVAEARNRKAYNQCRQNENKQHLEGRTWNIESNQQKYNTIRNEKNNPNKPLEPEIHARQ